jgi:hypothetical protein
MTEQKRNERNTQRLQELYPTFRVRIQKVIKDMEAMQLRPRIQDAYRSPADQLIAFNTGHSKLKFGFHNVTGANGKKEGLAVDMLDDNNPTNPSNSFLIKLAWASEKNGLSTGVRWGLPLKFRQNINDAIATKNWGSVLKIGWDPTHIEPVDVTVQEAKEGKRPV